VKIAFVLNVTLQEKNSKKTIENPERTFNIMRFEVLMMVSMKMAVFWVVAP
jgi:hypothetical protein